MKRLLYIVAVFVVTLSVSNGRCEIPKLINYQGMLTDDSGSPLTDTVDITFVIYDDPGPTGGNVKWDEIQFGVPVINGLFNVILGSSSPINLAFDQDYWLDITVEGEHMPERLRFTSVGYAYRARVADSATVAVSAPTGGGWTDDGTVVRLQNSSDMVGVGTTTPTSNLHIKGSDPTYLTIEAPAAYAPGVIFNVAGSNKWRLFYHPTDACLSFHQESFGDRMVIKDNGYVGIGTTDPNRKLHIVGDNPRILIEGSSGSPEVNFKNTGDLPSEVWALYKHAVTGDLRFYQGGDKLTIQDSTGYLGMGTTTPHARLHIQCTALDSSALYAEGNDLAGYGVYGKNLNSGDGVVGEGWYGVTGMGYESGTGVYGHNETSGLGGIGVQGWTDKGYGVVGQCSNGYAGYFDGDVDITGTLTGGKNSFKIDHPSEPEGKCLYHSYVGSSEMKNVYDGVVLLDGNGEAWVKLPEWFEALNRDFRYQLTPLGVPGPNLYVSQEIIGNRFLVAGGEPGMKVSWQVTGIRHDPYAAQNPISVEEEKSPADQGKYVNPEAYGMPKTAGLNYIEIRDPRRSIRREGGNGR
jgi:hypothetical protein